VKEYVLSIGSELDLDQIWEFIAQDNFDAADRWVQKIFESFAALPRNPGMGHSRRDLTEYPVLFWPVGAYLIIYREQNELVVVIAVTQGARDVPSFLHKVIE
jgi:plasmid stabilization system protein ParE